MIHVNVEITGMILRLSDEPTARTYRASMFVVGDEGVATIKAAMEVPAGSHVPVFRALKANGFHTVRWTRHREDGTLECREFNL
jgi:hypothetical protein